MDKEEKFYQLKDQIQVKKVGKEHIDTAEIEWDIELLFNYDEVGEPSSAFLVLEGYIVYDSIREREFLYRKPLASHHEQPNTSVVHGYKEDGILSWGKNTTAKPTNHFKHYVATYPDYVMRVNDLWDLADELGVDNKVTNPEFPDRMPKHEQMLLSALFGVQNIGENYTIQTHNLIMTCAEDQLQFMDKKEVDNLARFMDYYTGTTIESDSGEEIQTEE